MPFCLQFNFFPLSLSVKMMEDILFVKDDILPASEAERLHAASVINSDRKKTFFYPRYG